MIPKEKAKHLVERFHLIDNGNSGIVHEISKEQSALICVEEIISAFNFPKYNGDPETEINGDEIYWLDVKCEISLKIKIVEIDKDQKSDSEKTIKNKQ